MSEFNLKFTLNATITAEQFEVPELVDNFGTVNGKWDYGGELTISFDGAEDGKEYAIVPLRNFIPVLDISHPWGESPADHIAHMRGIADGFLNLAEELRSKADEYENRIKQNV